MYNYWKRVWAEINLDNLKHNFDIIKKCVESDTKICCVLKANAYGHDAPTVARALEEAGADWFAVSNIEEAIQLRRFDISLPILILGYTPPECAGLLSHYNISQCVFSSDYAEKLSFCAKSIGVNINVHIKIDTGMRRIGFVYDGSEAFFEEIEKIFGFSNLSIEGIFTHFSKSSAGVSDREFTDKQYSCFIDTVDKLEKKGYSFKLKHCSNSAAVFEYPEYQLDMVRAGIALYGLSPFDSFSSSVSELLPVMTLKTVVSSVKRISKGDFVGYGCDYVAERELTVATAPLGYADGFWRINGKSGQSLIVHGKSAPIIGRVSMDQLMLDVTDIGDVRVGDEITVFGDRENINSVDKIAASCNTVNYEIVCAVAERVSHVFMKNGEMDNIHFGLIDENAL